MQGTGIPHCILRVCYDLYFNKGLKMTWVRSKHDAHVNLTARIKQAVFDCLISWLIL